MPDGWATGFAVRRAGTGLHMDGTIPQEFRHRGAMDEFDRGDPVVIVRIPDEVEWDDLMAVVEDFRTPSSPWPHTRRPPGDRPVA